MKHISKLLIFLFISFIIFYLVKLNRFSNENFTPFINKRVRPLIRYSNQQLNSYPFPNVNRYLKYWELI